MLNSSLSIKCKKSKFGLKIIFELEKGGIGLFPENRFRTKRNTFLNGRKLFHFLRQNFLKSSSIIPKDIFNRNE